MRKFRIAVVISVAWIALALLLAINEAEHCRESRWNCRIDTSTFLSWFISCGALPLLIAWGVIWIQGGERQQPSLAEPQKPKDENKPISERSKGTQFRTCKICCREKKTRWVMFNENISYFFARRARTFSGFVCISCMSKVFFEFEAKTLLFTWWGIIGLVLGPIYILTNLIEYVRQAAPLLLRKKSCRHQKT